jgi:LacI family transcriptional regulator, repressor for deo operon, udp, cdd, tsx, nupC, and nupG
MLANAGCPLDEELLGYGAFDPDTGYRIMQNMLQVRPLPTAVFGLNDMMAFGALRAIREHGLRVPEDMAVVGFDDIRVAQFTTPPLTTINEPDIEHGRIAAEILMALIRGEAPVQRQIMLETRLIVRESCGG